MKGLLVTIAAVAAFASLFNYAFGAPIPASVVNVLNGSPEENKLVSEIEFNYVVLLNFCTATAHVLLTSTSRPLYENRTGMA